jgi:hypothetical protein
MSTAQQTFNTLAARVAKKLATRIKGLFPVWWTNRHDNSAGTVALATSSFQTTFKPEKREKVLVHCYPTYFAWLRKTWGQPFKVWTCVCV